MSKTGEAETLLLAEAENVQKTGERFMEWRIHGDLGQLYLKMERPEDAAKEMTSAGELIEEIATTEPDEELKQNFRRQALKTLKNN